MNGNMKLIDKDVLVAEMERRFKEHDSKKHDYAGTDHFWRAIEDKDILSFINTLEVKEVPEWKRATEDKLIGCLVWDEQRHFHLYNDRVFKGELYISMGDILELPNSPIKNKYDRQREEEHYQ